MTIYNYFKLFKRNVRIALVSVFTSVFKLLYKLKTKEAWFEDHVPALPSF